MTLIYIILGIGVLFTVKAWYEVYLDNRAIKQAKNRYSTPGWLKIKKEMDKLEKHNDMEDS